jgi:hypothetical protein
MKENEGIVKAKWGVPPIGEKGEKEAGDDEVSSHQARREGVTESSDGTHLSRTDPLLALL